MIYLDNNATTRPADEAVAAVEAALRSGWCNPSSVHRAGQEARRVVELAREAVAGLLGVAAREVTFTAGATESIDLAVRGVLAAAGASAARPGVFITDDAEHAAVRELAEDLERSGAAEVVRLPLGPGGVVPAAAVGAALAERDGARPAIVSVQWANNETGVIQPVRAIHAACRAARVAFHCDATQWVGKMPVDPADGGVGGPRPAADAGPPCDLLSCSAHKFHGPKGVGALWARRGARLRPLIRGTQELGRRGGTENVPGIAGMGAAARLAAAWLEDPAERARLARLRDRLEAGVVEGARAAGVEAVVNGPDTDPNPGPAAEPEPRPHADPEHGGGRLWNTTNIGFAGLEAEAVLLALSERGVCASAGAACSSGSLEPSPVLLAMGVPPRVAHGSVRFSLSRETSAVEIDEAIGVIVEAAGRVAGLTR